MSNSSLVSYTKISPHSNPRTHTIDKITIHHMAGNLSIEACGNVFQTRRASANYGVGSDGRVALYVPESRRAWTSSNTANDNRAVTIEVANDGGEPNWHVSDKALYKTIELCVDICKRNKIKALNFTGDASGNLTMHKYFIATACPGPYLSSKFKYIADQVNKRLKGDDPAPVPDVATYYVQVGAYKEKDNADKQLKATKAAGFDSFIKQEGGIYYVQVGAFGKKENAEKRLAEAKAAGFKDAFIKVGGPAAQSVAKPAEPSIKVGDTVKVKKGAETYDGGDLASFVYRRKHTVTELKGSRAVISYKGTVVAAVNVKDLTKA